MALQQVATAYASSNELHLYLNERAVHVVANANQTTTTTPKQLNPADQQQQEWTTLFIEPTTGSLNAANAALALVLVLIMLSTAIGNLFVIVAILIEKNLRTIGNYLVFSLAIADLMVSLLVMPLAGIYQLHDKWTLGVLLCDIWTSADVFCCTVSRVDYIRCQRSSNRILFMIFCVWLLAAIISLAPAFGWKDDNFESRIVYEFECLLSQDIYYQIFATCTTFYFPLTATLIFYWKIYQIARTRIRHKPGNKLAPQNTNQKKQMLASQKFAKKQQAETGVALANKASKGVAFETSVIKRSASALSLADGRECECDCEAAENGASGLVAGSSGSALSASRSFQASLDNSDQQSPDAVRQQHNQHPKPQYHRQSFCARLGAAAKKLAARNSSSDNPSMRCPKCEPHVRAGGLVLAAETATIAVSVAPAASAVATRTVAALHAESIESKRERKAAKVTIVITGAFVVCWLPFFVVAIAMPLLDLKPHKYLFALLLWLGYANSMLNPIIYTIFSPDFRKAFGRLLCAGGHFGEQMRGSGGGSGGSARPGTTNNRFGRGNQEAASGASPATIVPADADSRTSRDVRLPPDKPFASATRPLSQPTSPNPPIEASGLNSATTTAATAGKTIKSAQSRVVNNF